MNTHTKNSKRKPEKLKMTFEEFQTSLKKKEKRGKGDIGDINCSSPKADKKPRWKPSTNSDEEYLNELDNQIDSLEIENERIHSSAYDTKTEACKHYSQLPIISEEIEGRNLNIELDELEKDIANVTKGKSTKAEDYSQKSNQSKTK